MTTTSYHSHTPLKYRSDLIINTQLGFDRAGHNKGKGDKLKPTKLSPGDISTQFFILPTMFQVEFYSKVNHPKESLCHEATMQTFSFLLGDARYFSDHSRVPDVARIPVPAASISRDQVPVLSFQQMSHPTTAFSLHCLPMPGLSLLSSA